MSRGPARKPVVVVGDARRERCVRARVIATTPGGAVSSVPDGWGVQLARTRGPHQGSLGW